MDLPYEKDDFKQCILPTFELPMSTDLMKAFPLLEKLSGFEYDFANYTNPIIEKNKTIRYINYFYSKGTPIEVDYPEYKKRKVAAAVLAGFGYSGKTGEFDGPVTAMLQGRDAMVNRMIVSFLAFNYSTEYSSLMAIRDMFQRTLEDTTDPSKVEKVFSINERLRGLEISLLRGDESPGLSVSLIQRMEEVRLELKPEDVAQRISKGLKPIDFEIYG